MDLNLVNPTAVLTMLREATRVAKEIGKLDLYEKLVDLQAEVLKVSQQISGLHEENKGLREQLQFQGKLTFKAPFYFAEGEPTPYCPRCWDVSRIAVHLHEVGMVVAGHRYDCPNCKNMVIDIKKASKESVIMATRSRSREFEPY